MLTSQMEIRTPTGISTIRSDGITTLLLLNGTTKRSSSISNITGIRVFTHDPYRSASIDENSITSAETMFP